MYVCTYMHNEVRTPTDRCCMYMYCIHMYTWIWSSGNTYMVGKLEKGATNLTEMLCVCTCVCARARVCVCVCGCREARGCRLIRDTCYLASRKEFAHHLLPGGLPSQIEVVWSEVWLFARRCAIYKDRSRLRPSCKITACPL